MMSYMFRAFHPLDRREACEILAWQYEGIYAFYNTSNALSGEPAEGDLAEMLDDSYVATRDEQGRVAGFFCFGAAARVPGGYAAGVYVDDALDVGLGLRPDLTGLGLGEGFVRAGLCYARSRYAPARFRLVVALFNARAVRLYERVGFRAGIRFMSATPDGQETEFLAMTIQADQVGQPN